MKKALSSHWNSFHLQCSSVKLPVRSRWCVCMSGEKIRAVLHAMNKVMDGLHARGNTQRTRCSFFFFFCYSVQQPSHLFTHLVTLCKRLTKNRIKMNHQYYIAVAASPNKSVYLINVLFPPLERVTHWELVIVLVKCHTGIARGKKSWQKKNAMKGFIWFFFSNNTNKTERPHFCQQQFYMETQ